MRAPIDEHFLATVAGLPDGAAVKPSGVLSGNTEMPAAPLTGGLTGARALELFDAQLGSRHLDFAARELGATGRGYYSIGSAGHEGNVALAAALRPTDPALLHYRSGAFYLERARQVPGMTPLRDVLLGITAAAEEPIAGGRHKVFGHKALNIIPLTSTIASHCPRALGLAFGIERARKLGRRTEWPEDAVVVCGIGDASANHSTATGAINAALLCAYQGLPMPLLFVCEDNGIGISVRTPSGWLETAYGNRPGLRFFDVDTTDLAETLPVAREAVDWVRGKRVPAFLRLRTVRLMGHAGSDVESGYRAQSEIAADHDRDPLLGTARLLVRTGIATPAQILERYERKRAEVARLAEQAVGRPKLTLAQEVMAPLAPERPARVAERAATFGTPETGAAMTVAQGINRGIADILASDDGALVFGEDVAVKGGVYGVTRGLRARFDAARVFDSPLDEQSVLGTALGTALAGFLPIAEIQYLAYVHNAADQLRGEASTLRFFSQGQYQNPMIVRIASYAYQKGFGGHFHNDNAVAALRDIPGVVVASPARADDVIAMLHTCAAAGRVDGRVCVFLEPIALYHTRDLHESEDNGWLAGYPAGHVPIGSGRVHGDGTDLTLVSFANGLRMSLRVVRRLAGRGIGCRVLDLRWLAPLPVADLMSAASATGRVLVVDETRRTGGVSESVLTALADNGFAGRAARVTSADSFIPLGPAANSVLLSEQDIEKAALELLG